LLQRNDFGNAGRNRLFTVGLSGLLLIAVIARAPVVA